MIGERIGGGGMAEVYRSTLIGVEGFTRTVAVKRILGNFSADTTFAEMFVNEANIASLLTHPNIVSVLDFDRDESGQLFLVMELVEGCDLKQLADGGSLPIELSTFVTGEVMRALSFAHSLEREGRSLAIVHRDISPHNVLVSWDGAVKLSDFGIAKATEATRVTQTGMIKGKVSYMSPEQVEGTDLDSRSDLFSAGILLHELLTGHRLFDGPSDRAVLNRILIGEIAPPSATNPAVPPELDRICLRLLERELDRRYQRARDVIEDLLLTNLISPRAQLDLARLMKERGFDRRARTSPPADPWADELRTDPGPGTAAPFVSAPTLEKPDIDFASPAIDPFAKTTEERPLDPRTPTALDRPRPLAVEPELNAPRAPIAPPSDTKASGLPSLDPRGDSTDPILDRSAHSPRPTIDPDALDPSVGRTAPGSLRPIDPDAPSSGRPIDPIAPRSILPIDETTRAIDPSGTGPVPSGPARAIEGTGARAKVGRAVIGVGVLLVLAGGVALVGPRLRFDPPAPPPPTVAPPAERRVRITSNPSGAAVHLEGAADPIGTTPFELTVHPGEMRPIELRLAGHRSAFHELRDEDLHVELAKLPVPKKRKKRTRDGILPPEKQIGDGILRPNL